METFVGKTPHRPLSSTDPSEVRLVKLLPAKFDDPIQCKLEHVSLASAPSFIALSYTWGDSTVTAPVQLHDEEYPATSNLRSFLRHMQSLLGDVLDVWRAKSTLSGSPVQSVLDCLLRNLPNENPKSRERRRRIEEAVLELSGEMSSERSIELGVPVQPHDRVADTEEPGVYLWIDAICINQLDTQERNRQVARMSHIYKSASSLFIWLEDCAELEDTTDSAIESAFAVMGDITELLEPGISNNWDFKDQTLRLAPISAEDLEAIEPKFSKPLRKHSSGEQKRRLMALQYVAKIVDAPWFTRVWIIQEIALSRGRITAWCKFYSLPWTVFASLGSWCCDIILGYESSVLKLGGLFDRTQPLAMIIQWYQNQHQDNQGGNTKTQGEKSRTAAARWLELLLLTENNFKSTNPRDMVYGLFGLLGDEIQAKIQPDYNASVAQVFHQCTVFLLQNTDSLEFILSSWRGIGDGAPSWVPDWTTFHSSMDGDESDTTTSSIPQHVTMTGGSEVSTDGACLMVDGVVLGRVISVETQQLESSLDSDDTADASLAELIPTLGRRLLQVETFFWERFAALLPPSGMAVEEFRMKWERLWDITDEDTRYVYDILVGRREPPEEEGDLDGGLYESSAFFLPLKMETLLRQGIAIIEGGHLATCKGQDRQMWENDLVCVIRGVSGGPCILRPVEGARYQFVGMCNSSTYGEDIERFTDSGEAVERFVLV